MVYEKNIIPHIEAIYSSFTQIEKTIADFFINNTEDMDFSAKNVASHLYVSEASLSRFAKKCGYKGYREFLFHYKQSSISEKRVESNLTKNVLNMYQELLNRSYSLVDEAQMLRLVDKFKKYKRILVYGLGSSGMVGQEMKIRFVRIGVNIETVTDTDLMKINSVLLDDECMVIGISVSGKSVVVNSLKEAKQRGAATVLFTSRKDPEYKKFVDELVLLAVKENLENGMAISPQFPILVLVDILFSNILESDKFRRVALHESTLSILDKY